MVRSIAIDIYGSDHLFQPFEKRPPQNKNNKMFGFRMFGIRALIVPDLSVTRSKTINVTLTI